MAKKPREHRNIPITVLLTPTVTQALRAAAKRDNRTVSTWLELLIRSALRK